MTKWLAINIDGEDLEEKCSLLFEFGVSGSSIEADGSAICYCTSESDSISSELSRQIAELGLSVRKIEAVEETNWTQKCDELFEEVQIESLRIIPLRTSEQGKEFTINPKRDLLIIPGTGFGTGHHPTTFNILKLLQDPSLLASSPKTVLDAGAGSGILAIGACRLFDCVVDAYEIDPLAVENAQENIQLNKLSDRINLFCESVHKCEATYDLVVANLYAELLEILCSHLVERGKLNSCFLFSGIRAELAEGVIRQYSACGLECMKRVDTEGWVALMFKKN